MSHFTVAVITEKNNREEIEKILEPYWEELEVEPYIDKTKTEIIAEAKKWKNIFKNKERIDFSQEFMDKYLTAETDEELYQIEIDEYEKYDESGNHLSTYNPNSKWDWYSIGGRWNKILLTKKEQKDIIEEQYFGLFNYCDNKETPDGYKWVNGAKIKDIDFNKMSELSKQQFYTWALVDEKGWYEQGQMGWWAMNNATDDSTNTFVEKFQEYINDPSNQDKYLTIVDCHI